MNFFDDFWWFLMISDDIWSFWVTLGRFFCASSEYFLLVCFGMPPRSLLQCEKMKTMKFYTFLFASRTYNSRVCVFLLCFLILTIRCRRMHFWPTLFLTTSNFQPKETCTCRRFPERLQLSPNSIAHPNAEDTKLVVETSFPFIIQRASGKLQFSNWFQSWRGLSSRPKKRNLWME